MALNIIKSTATNTGGGGFLSLKEMKDYPLLFVKTLRSGERPNHFDNTKINDYIVADVIGLNNENKIVMAADEVLIDQGRNKKGGVGAVIQDLQGIGYHAGSLTKGEKQMDPYIWEDVDLTLEQEEIIEAALTSDSSAPAQASVPVPQAAQETPWANSLDSDAPAPF